MRVALMGYGQQNRGFPQSLNTVLCRCFSDLRVIEASKSQILGRRRHKPTLTSSWAALPGASRDLGVWAGPRALAPNERADRFQGLLGGRLRCRPGPFGWHAAVALFRLKDAERPSENWFDQLSWSHLQTVG